MCSFVDALYARYDAARYSQSMRDCPVEIFVTGGLPAPEDNELVLPPALALTGCRISRAGHISGDEEWVHRLRSHCSTVEELDLGCNAIRHLEEILKILHLLPNLRFLNLSENDLTFFDSTPSPSSSDSETSPTHSASNATTSSRRKAIASILSSSSDTVKSLVLNNTHIPWSGVNALLDALPKVEDLHLSLNDYTSVELDPVKTYPAVKRLHVSGNPHLSDWDHIHCLARAFPCLEGLSMADSNLSTIDERLRDLLPSLAFMNIANWPIDEWEELEKLNNFPYLHEIRCTGLRVLERDHPSAEMRRVHLIARLPNICRLNGSEITPDERVWAELSFLRHFIIHEDLPRPQRFFELQAIHGRVEPLAELDFSPPQHADVRVIFNSESNNDNNSSAQQQQQQSTAAARLESSSEGEWANECESSAESRHSSGDYMSTSPVSDVDCAPSHVMSSSAGSSSSACSSGSCGSTGVGPGTRIKPMKVDLNKSVKDFKQQLSSMFGLSPGQMRVFYVDHEMVDIVGPEELKFNQKKLYTYNVQDGDQFLIDPK